MSPEYLVFYETDEPGDDEIHLEAHSNGMRHRFDVEADMDVTFDNEPSPAGKAGLTISIISFIVGIIAWGAFLSQYPAQWFENTEPVSTTTQMVIAATALISMFGLAVGAVLTIVGRKIAATAQLNDIHLIDLGKA